jgi:predicted dehydrogenase
VAVCDVDPDSAESCGAELGVRQFTDVDEALREERPDVVAICTNNTTHAPLAIRAASAGARGVYCEKPMATNMADARAMVETCHKAGAVLVVNHQRRLGADLVEMRRLIQSGAIGEVKLLRGRCAGDILSDGTHLIDSIMWLARDGAVDWVFGQVHRDMAYFADKGERLGRRGDEPGFRYGHPVESGGFGVCQFTSGLRAEILCGDMIEKGRAYQDYEVHGTRGRLWRTGDRKRPNLFIQDAAGGDWKAGKDDWVYKPVPCDSGERGQWRAVEPEPLFEGSAIAEGYRRLVHSVFDTEDHPMSGEVALRGFEVLMAVYESARLNRRIDLPLAQDRFPLEVMIEEGRL